MTPPAFSPDARLRVQARYPVARLAAAVSIARPRPLDPIEWAVLAAVDAIDGVDASEMAVELGIGDPRFVQATIDDLAALAAVAQDDAQGLALTPRGRAQFAKGRVDGRPDKRFARLTFDAIHLLPLIDEAIASDTLPLLVEEPAPPAAIALTQAEAAVRVSSPKLLDENGEVIACELTDARIEWCAATVRFAVTGATLSIAAVEPDPGPRTDWLAQVGPAPEVLARLAERHAWAGDVEALVGDVGVEPANLIGLVHDATQRVALDRRWLAAPGLRGALDAALARGVRVVVVGADQSRSEAREAAWWVELPGQSTVAALVIDDATALIVGERTCYAAWSGEAVALRWIQTQTGADVARVRAQLLAGLEPVADEAPVPAAARVDLGVAPVEHLQAALMRHLPDPLDRLVALPPFETLIDAELPRQTWRAALAVADDSAGWQRLLAHAEGAEERAACIARIDPVRVSPRLADTLEAPERARLRAQLRDEAVDARIVGALVRLGPDENDHAWAKAHCAQPPGWADIEAWAKARLPLRLLVPALPMTAIVAVGLRPHRRSRRAAADWHGGLEETRAVLDRLGLLNAAADRALAQALMKRLEARGAPPLPLADPLVACWAAGPAQREALRTIAAAALPRLDGLDDVAIWLELLADLGAVPIELSRALATAAVAPLAAQAKTRRADDQRWWTGVRTAWAQAGLKDTWLDGVWPRGRKKNKNKKRRGKR